MLTCKVCSHTSNSEIVSHIEEAHADLAGGVDTLTWYMEKFEADISDVAISDEPTTKPTKKAAGEKKMSEVAVTGGVKIRSKSLPKQSGYGAYVPRVNPAYHFGEFVDDLCQDISEGKKAMLVGHTGCGKTSSVEQIAARIEQGVIRVNMNGQTTIGDFVGLWTVKGGETVWVDGVLPMAMRMGLWLVVDELDFAEPAILSVLNAVLEPHGRLCLKEKGHEMVEPHPNFRLFSTANGVGCMASYRGLYQGTNLMNEAFLDRWRVYHVDYLPAEEEIKVLVGSVPRMNEKIATVIVRVAGLVREAFKKEEIQCTFSLRRLIDWSEMMIRHKDPLKAAETTVFSKISKEDADVVKEIMKRVMVGNKS